MSDQVQAPLPQGAGYGVVVGFGVAFALGMIWVTRSLRISFNEDNKSTETFMVANRTVGTGLTASAVVSSWLYSTALLGASLLTYKYGLALGVWWGASASTMVCFLSLISIEAKRRAPNAHTLLELIRVRYGTAAHLIWIVFCLLTNILNFSSMLLGASAAVTSLTGMNVIASTYLLPVGVGVYTYFGGLRATFLTDYIHTFIIMIILAWVTIKIIVVKEIGSIGALYNAVTAADKIHPVQGNYGGSHLTMRSEQCLYFGILHVISNFGAVIMDTGFWQKGFSADVASAVPGYVLGGIASFSVPWAIGTFGGLAAVALESTDIFPTYPRMMTAEEVTSGLVLPYVVQAVAGKAGAGALLVTIFMACTSIASAQMIAISSIISFDIYGTYFNKNATDKQLITWSHIGVVATSLVIPTLATAFNKGGVDMTWLLYMVGNITNPGCIPTVFALLWKGQTKAAAVVSPLVGVCCSLSVWLGTTYAYFGEISVASTGSTMPCLFGCVTAFFVPLPITVIVSLVRPTSFDWSAFTKQIHKVRRPEQDRTEADQHSTEEWVAPEMKRYMKRMSRWAAFWTVFTLLGHIFLWPLAMYGAKIVFSKSLFTAWIVVSLIYLWFTLVVANFYPLYDGGARKIWIVLCGQVTPEASSKSEPQQDTSGYSSEGPPKNARVEAKVLPAS
ncbi:sodium/proline symporter [Annulohypoxylon truncatum]|uniref:sodium/proline symporter n=1 Tax=Annulohypoxylon truncatum TaxID=327061 RepID=UPI002008AE98|nr:sodium/proline symporter [Annulohypoxylon truncatum]KAI1206058.1 sodium/proline symporter [Annulohypoxylon truncatum]